MRLLIIGGSSQHTYNLTNRLQIGGCSVDHVFNMEEAVYYLAESEPDACMLCITSLNHREIKQIHRWRKKGNGMPVIVFKADSVCEERIHALNAGADDFITSSLDINEILARLNAIARRCHGQSSSVIIKSPYVLDTKARRLRIHNKLVELTFFEYMVMETLMRRTGAIVSHETLLKRLYSDGDRPEGSVLSVLICRLRKKISAAGGGKCIISQRLFGYSFKPECGTSDQTSGLDTTFK